MRDCQGGPVRRYFFEGLALLLMIGSLVFFFECVGYLARRDYVAALILMVIGLSVIAVGKEMARLALVQKE
jgi:hypothetical protein